jgi:hypothetical protein
VEDKRRPIFRCLPLRSFSSTALENGARYANQNDHSLKREMGPTRFERVTSRLSAVRSTWLSYGPGPHSALMIPLITVSLNDLCAWILSCTLKMDVIISFRSKPLKHLRSIPIIYYIINYMQRHLLIMGSSIALNWCNKDYYHGSYGLSRE